MALHITIYGKGGVGKSTLAANLAAALAEMGKRVVLVGCDPKCDSAILLHSGDSHPSIIEQIASEKTVSLDDIVTSGYRGIACIEVGDPFHTGECASRGFDRAFALLHELDAFGRLDPDLVLYDIAGDLGCPGFINPFGNFPGQQALVVTSADFQSIYAANRFIGVLAQQPSSRSIALVANGMTGSFEDSFVADFARQVSVQFVAAIPRSLVVRHCELYGKTVIEAAPLSTHAFAYRRLARQVADAGIPPSADRLKPLAAGDLREWARSWGERLGEVEFGLIQDGAGI